MESFTTNCARSFLGKNVNLHMKDGSVIVNVRLGKIQGEFKKQKFITYLPYGENDTFTIPLKSIAWAETLNLTMITRDRSPPELDSVKYQTPFSKNPLLLGRTFAARRGQNGDSQTETCHQRLGFISRNAN